MKLLFDFGGVIVDLKKEAATTAFDDLGFDIRPFLGTFKQGGVFALLENGDITVADFCNELREAAKKTELTDESIVRAWEAYLVGIPTDRLELLLKIRRNYPTYVLSNTNPIHWEQGIRDFFSWNGHRIEDYFDRCFLSYEMHLQKPDAAIFHAVAANIGGAPEDILFLDDSEDNCEAARCCGLQARLAPAGGVWLQYFDENGFLLEPTV